jgi:GTPase SAR1 family protein
LIIVGLTLLYYNYIQYCMQRQNTRSSIAFSLHSKVSLKIIVVGDRAVGKTSLIVRFVKGTFDKNYKVTVGV